MTRQVDIKALISHIVRGDGGDKCRICMGDTSEGQVYLGDTIMMDDEKPVTLAELLESITGVTVPLEDGMPTGLCSTCTTAAFQAAEFRILCCQAAANWDSLLELMTNLPLPEEVKSYEKSIFAILHQNSLTIIKDLKEDHKLNKSGTTKSPLVSLKKNLKPKIYYNKYGKRLSPFCCLDCGKKFPYALDIADHFKESTDFRRACRICGDIMLRDELIPHIKQKHGIKSHPCKKCSAVLLNSKQFAQHMKKNHAPGECTCGDCGRTFKSLPAYHAHLNIHVVKTCPGCNTQFRNQPCYLYHVKHCCNLDKTRADTFETKGKIMVEVKNAESKKKIRVGMRGSALKECICDYCGKTFAGKKFVGAHIQIVHMKNTHKPCTYCGKLLAAAHMGTHLKKHEEDQSFTCEHCGLVLKSRLGYIQHNRLHTGEKPYKCKYCVETFSASSRRSEHMRKVHRTSEIVLKHACKLCPARFRLPYRLRKHVATVHGAEGADHLRFECSTCHEKFSSFQGLLHHSRKHQQLVMPLKRSQKSANVSTKDLIQLEDTN